MEAGLQVPAARDEALALRRQPRGAGRGGQGAGREACGWRDAVRGDRRSSGEGDAGVAAVLQGPAEL